MIVEYAPDPEKLKTMTIEEAEELEEWCRQMNYFQMEGLIEAREDDKGNITFIRIGDVQGFRP